MAQVDLKYFPPFGRRGTATSSPVDTRFVPHQKSSFVDRFAVVLFLGVALLAVWFRAPFVTHGLPYLYDEDEGHHFNRVVRMLKSGDLNPHYFYKPALHFYLRLPVTALAVLKGVEDGQLHSLDDVTTKNRYGIAGYEFTASHSILVKYNRAFTVLLCLLSAWLVFEIGATLGSSALGLLASLLFVLSPAVIQLSTHIGVDMLMCFFMLLSVFLSLRFVERRQLSLIIFSSLAAGLAVASKYNAFPAVAVPLLALSFVSLQESRLRIERSSSLLPIFSAGALVLFFAALGFLIGAPYSLLDLPAFLDGAAFEVHHYKTGNGISPGWEQLQFYSAWLGNSALGWPLLVLACIGVAAALANTLIRVRVALLLCLPVLYGIYMCSQRVNYTRNTLPVIPFLCLFAAYGIVALVSRFRTRLMAPILILAVIVPLLIPALQLRSANSSTVESRDDLTTWLKEHPLTGSVGVAGELQLPHEIRNHDAVDQFSFKKFLTGETTPAELRQRGYDYVIVPNPVPSNLQGRVVKEFPGKPFPQRLPNNPGMSVIQLGK